MKLKHIGLCAAAFFSLVAVYVAMAATPTQSVKTVSGVLVVPNCGSVPGGPYVAGTYVPATIDTNGQQCSASGGGGTSTSPGPLAIVPLDVASVTTGASAVTALTAGHRNKGGWLLNPVGATVNLCINEAGGTASGTTSAGSLVCITPGNSFNLAPSALAVSVVTSDSAHAFAGEGYN